MQNEATVHELHFIVLRERRRGAVKLQNFTISAALLQNQASPHNTMDIWGWVTVCWGQEVVRLVGGGHPWPPPH